MKQKELASQLNVSNSTISAWEIGRNQPSYEQLNQIAHYFDVTTDYLLGMTDEWGNMTDIQKSPAELSADKKELLTVYDSLSPTRKQDVLTLVKSFAFADASKK